MYSMFLSRNASADCEQTRGIRLTAVAYRGLVFAKCKPDGGGGCHLLLLPFKGTNISSMHVATSPNHAFPPPRYSTMHSSSSVHVLCHSRCGAQILTGLNNLLRAWTFNIPYRNWSRISPDTFASERYPQSVPASRQLCHSPKE